MNYEVLTMKGAEKIANYDKLVEENKILKEHNVVRVNDWQEILDKILKLEKNEGKDLLESI